MNKKIIKDTVALVLITLVAVLCLSFAYELTKEPIAEAEAKERMDSYYSVFNTAGNFDEVEAESLAAASEKLTEVTVNEALFALDKEGNTIGLVMSLTSPSGYGGDITLSIGIDGSGTVTGLKVTSMSETPSLGAKCTEESFAAGFIGKDAKQPLTYTKSGMPEGNEIDAISGATVTTTAITDAVNDGFTVWKNLMADASAAGTEGEG